MNVAPTAIYAYPYTAWCGKTEAPEVFIGEIEAHSTNTARSRIRALHRALHVRVPRTIKLGAPQFLRTSQEGGFVYRFYRNGRPVNPIELVKSPWALDSSCNRMAP